MFFDNKKSNYNEFTVGGKKNKKRRFEPINPNSSETPFGEKKVLFPIQETLEDDNKEDLIDEILKEKKGPAIISSERLGEVTEDEELDIIAKELTPPTIKTPKFISNKVKDKTTAQEGLTILGRTKHWSTDYNKFGYYQHDRALHTHLIGESGGGKSTLLLNMFVQDMWNGRGGMILDPHGDVAENLLERVPPWRLKDVVYLDFTDKSNFIGLNALETFNDTQEEKQDATEAFISLMKKQFGSSWGPNLENILRYSLLTLAETPGMTPLEIRPLLSNTIFNAALRKNIKDKAVAEWWEQKFDKMSRNAINQQTASLENKISQLIANFVLRGILGQSRTTIDFSEIMDSGKIVIVNISKGHTSALVSEFVGSILVSKVLGASLSRQGRIEEPERERFALLIDEFQNFCNEDFATILSEARKYGLSLTVAHQNMGQLADLPTLKNSIENNVQNRIVYGIGPQDGKYMEKFMLPLTASDLINLPQYNIAVKIRVDGAKSKAFTAVTLPPIGLFPESQKIADLVYQRSLKKYTKPRIECEAEYNNRQNYGREVITNISEDDDGSSSILL